MQSQVSGVCICCPCNAEIDIFVLLSFVFSGVVINKSDAKNGNSSVCQEACPEVIKSHDVSEPSPRSDSTGVNHSGVELKSTTSGQEPTATSPPAARERSVGSDFVAEKQEVVYKNLYLCFMLVSI